MRCSMLRFEPVKKLSDTHDFAASFNQAITEVRSEKAGAPCHQD